MHLIRFVPESETLHTATALSKKQQDADIIILFGSSVQFIHARISAGFCQVGRKAVQTSFTEKII